MDEGKEIQTTTRLSIQVPRSQIKHEITISPYEDEPVEITTTNNPLLNGIRTGLRTLPEELLLSLGLTIDILISAFPDSYSIYTPMLLLPHNAFSAAPWTRLLSSHPIDSPTLTPLWNKLATTTGTTHIAINASIPLQNEATTPNPSNTQPQPSPNENILRSPSNLTPIHGPFGPKPTPQTLTAPTPTSFASTLWVSHTQNTIHQTWAPLYTMFSRGNMREKTRLLTLPSIASSAQEPGGCTAVDLYAGIGYFAFSYKKAGVSKVLCWELNPWSIEGLRRGARRNKWKTQIFTTFPHVNEAWAEWAKSVDEATDFLVFQQSNENALSAIASLDTKNFHTPRGEGQILLPPIRHVNLGLLPTSRLSWSTAVKIVDRELGGWVYAHENVGVNDIEKRKGEVVEEMQRYLDQWEGEKGSCGTWRRVVMCEHVEMVKTYAPGVVHVVFDVWVGGMRHAVDLLA
ncbi:hypothetical protein CC80DRAFT_526114 [Byssothecium circinans]|uniref:tRNA wybutosine-synthesizing protein 2 n=1 Tax=Byssothecium circinans TaxID=147558 RepID=A0A6A5TVH4_9PLEO|nr:hypothetical protein CC80DRAFT_526114 [Byssothecium circinans]